MYFPVSDVEIPLWLPPLAAFVISFFTSMGGISGAVLLLPFQVSCLGIITPDVSATNFSFNIFAIPGGVYHYLKEGRVSFPILWVILFGTIPGLFIGTNLRITFLPDPKTFKLFAGIVLLFVAVRIIFDIIQNHKLRNELTLFGNEEKKESKQFFRELFLKKFNPIIPQNSYMKTTYHNYFSIKVEFNGETFLFSSIKLFILSFFVGIVGGAYGIGGGAIIAPFLVTFFGLPVYLVAGVALISTFINSICGVILYSFMGINADWLMGLLFGAGGFLGIYLGAVCQRFLPQNVIKTGLILILLFLGIRYFISYF